MKPVHLEVLQVVSHCAGRLIPPVDHELDEVSVRIRIVAAFIVSPTGRYPSAATRHARQVVLHHIRDGHDSELVELLTLALGQLAQVPEAARGGEQQQGPGEAARDAREMPRTLAVVVGDDAAPAPAAEGSRPCPTIRRGCDRSTCRHHLGPDAPHPCVLEVARHGPLKGHVIASIMGGVSTQRIHQLEQRALRKLGKHRHLLVLRPDPRKPTYAEQLELAAPGRYDIALRGSPEDWRS